MHGVPRYTADMDMMVDLEDKDNSLTLFEAMKEIGYVPKVPVSAEQFTQANNRKKWKEEKNMVVFSFVNHNKPIYIVDVFIENPIDFKKAYSNRRIDKVDDYEISVIPSEDLIFLKKLSNREQDRSDIESLKKVLRIINDK